MQQVRVLLLPFILGLLVIANHAYAAPKSKLWPMWNKSDDANLSKIDHQDWQTILTKYVIKRDYNNLFRYADVSDEDKALLEKYLSDLTQMDPRDYSRSEQFAYWINLYNALTVKLILDEYPVKSITKLGGFMSFGPWDEDVAVINGEDITLNDIEHRILRPIWNDPRIHYAVNCASLGCPNLSDEAYDGENMEKLLTEAARQFTNSPKCLLISDNTLIISSIYDWYGSDFGDDEQAILREIDKYRDGKKLEGWSGKIKYEYDWSLNQP
ncbi:hypothetical protein BCT30_10545 [Enterovibrio norvegicus]|uniref:DUF547 domain-containing protein n=1 Tax=Enterovibrio norvegicus TaxID=188144 RepID=UPI000C849EA1|nr:DUF547 domain-containing protein [Enterovibrio norvegicus]MCC4799104.1 DUF547 domain-containing protein [Enterovibrio norvegicus]PMI34227.1 hypothetical protein BCU47_07275 [Enterovibrio norvegicus]PMI41831.1 hypothetical protein BCU46_00285 [Enterovibrio norvegicus]PMN53810.1 hypothetical protein BCT30_10545 [Enterovibrio norvegicus]